MALTFGDVIGWIIIGLIAGWLASMIMGRGGYGIVGDIVVGLVGALIGGFLANLFNFGRLNANDPISWGSLVLSLIGAIVLIAALRALSGGKTRL